MKPATLTEGPGTSRDAERPGEPVSIRAEVTIDEPTGTIRVRDARVFHAGRRAFCRRLVEAAAGRPGVRKAEADLESASCQVVFAPGSACAHAMADAFAAAVREASAASETRGAPFGRHTARWSALTAYPEPQAATVSLWETLARTPGRASSSESPRPSSQTPCPLLLTWPTLSPAARVSRRVGYPAGPTGWCSSSARTHESTSRSWTRWNVSSRNGEL